MINPTDNDESDDNNRSDESAIIGEVQTHEAICQSVQENIDRNVERIRQKMLGRGGRLVQSFNVGDVIRLRIPVVESFCHVRCWRL